MQEVSCQQYDENKLYSLLSNLLVIWNVHIVLVGIVRSIFVSYKMSVYTVYYIVYTVKAEGAQL